MPDELWIRCPRLGGEVPFSYCLKEAGELPCHRTLVCWQPFFPVEAWLKERLSADQWELCFSRTQREKMVSLVELIEKAKDGQRE